MLYFSRWKIIAISTAVAMAVLFALPNLFSRDQLAGRLKKLFQSTQERST